MGHSSPGKPLGIDLGSDAGFGNQLISNSLASGGINEDGSGPTFASWSKGLAGTVTGGLDKALSPPTAPDPAAPPPPPSAASIRQGQVNQQLGEEQRQYAASTVLTGGSGLIDEPTTASRVLLGS